MKQKVKSYNLGQLRSAWGAGMAKSSKNDPLIHMFFHRLNKEGEIELQGMIMKKYQDDEYFVMLFNFLDGTPSHNREIICFKEKKRFSFYDTARDMRLASAQLNNLDRESWEAQELLIKMQGCK